MMDAQAKLIHSRIWDLLYDYADIRDELESALDSIRSLYEDLETAVWDIGGELDTIEEHLSKTSRSLKSFRGSDAADTLPPEKEEEEALPWN